MQRSMSMKLSWAVIAVGLIVVLLVVVAGPMRTASPSLREGTAISVVRVANQAALPPVSSPEYPTSLPQPYYTPEPIPTLLPPPAATSLPAVTGPLPNIAWSAESNSTLTIWVGHYSDSPAPSIQGARPVVRWNAHLAHSYVDVYLRLVNMAVSPDNKSLAVLLREVCEPLPPEPTATPVPDPTPGPPPPSMPNVDGPCMGDFPTHPYVLDLGTNKAQSIPDYKYYSLYAASKVSQPEKVLGWFDNNRLGLSSGQMLVATKDGASLVQREWPNAGPYGNVSSLFLLPDHKTIFGWLLDGFYLRDADTGDVRKVGNYIKGFFSDSITPSPDGMRIAYLDPNIEHEMTDMRHLGLGIQDFATDAFHKVISSGLWDPYPAWSPNGSQIAFAHVDFQPNNDYTDISQPEGAETNVYIADTTNTFTSRQLTSFTGAHNSSIKWTPENNLVLSSTAGSKTGKPGIVAVSTKDGRATVLVSPAPGEALVDPLMFGPTLPNGMPHVGADPNP